MTIGAAVSAATAGSTIYVCPGIYPEQVVITKNLSIVGLPSNPAVQADWPQVVPPPATGIPSSGYKVFEPLLNGATANAQIAVIGGSKCSNVNISGLLLNGLGNKVVGGNGAALFGIFYQNASGNISNNIVANYYTPGAGQIIGDGSLNGYGIYVESSNQSNPANVTINNNGVLNYQANGISSVLSIANVYSNSVAIDTADGFSNPYAPNAIEILQSDGSTVALNVISGATSGPGAAFAGNGILIDASSNMEISGNTISNSDYGILTLTDSSNIPVTPYQANNNTIEKNTISATTYVTGTDAIDVCGDYNTIEGNTINGFDNSGIHLDASAGCFAFANANLPSGTQPFTAATIGAGNFVQFNTISTGVCTGIAEGGDSNAVSFNTVSNVAGGTAYILYDYCQNTLPSNQSTVGSQSQYDFNDNDVYGTSGSGYALNQLLDQIFVPLLVVKK